MEQRECGWCSKDISHKAPTAKFCSKECGEYSSGRRVDATPRTCPVCRATFEASNNQRFCCRNHGKAYDNAKRRGTLDSLLARGGVGTPFDCAQCDQACVPGKNGVAHHARKFCGYDCKHKWHKVYGKQYEPSPSSVQRARRKARREKAKTKLAKAARGKPSKTTWFGGTCPHCGDVFLTNQPKQVQCGKTRCAKKQSRAYASQRGRHLNARGRKITRITGADYEPIDRQKIFERDELVCGICGEATDPRAEPSTPRYPSIDHVIPLSRGGNHTAENVQCACFQCNWMKGDQLATGATAAALPMF